MTTNIIDRAQTLWNETVCYGILERENATEAANLLEALSKERYAYTAQVLMSVRWIFMWSPRTGNSVEGKWKTTHKDAEKFAEQWQLDHPTRIVKRRVSPIEVSE